MDVTGNYNANSVSGGQPSPAAPAYPRAILKGVGAAPAAVAAAPVAAPVAAPTSAATAAAVTAPAPVAAAPSQSQSVAGVLSGLTQPQQDYLGPAGPPINELLTNYAAAQAARSPQQVAIDQQNRAIQQQRLQAQTNPGGFGAGNNAYIIPGNYTLV